MFCCISSQSYKNTNYKFLFSKNPRIRTYTSELRTYSLKFQIYVTEDILIIILPNTYVYSNLLECIGPHPGCTCIYKFMTRTTLEPKQPDFFLCIKYIRT